jgi:hypothetical protein
MNHLTQLQAGWTLVRPDRAVMITGESEPTVEVSAARPLRLYPDGNQWCALWGDDIQSGVAGFGDTPALALNALLTSVKALAGQD